MMQDKAGILGDSCLLIKPKRDKKCFVSYRIKQR
jgi:hypothetical protein